MASRSFPVEERPTASNSHSHQSRNRLQPQARHFTTDFSVMIILEAKLRNRPEAIRGMNFNIHIKKPLISSHET